MFLVVLLLVVCIMVCRPFLSAETGLQIRALAFTCPVWAPGAVVFFVRIGPIRFVV